MRTPQGSGDSPLSPLATISGNVDVFVDVIPFVNARGTSGTFVVSGLPAGASIERAWLLVTSFDFVPDVPVTATFGGTPLGTKLPDVSDPEGTGSFLYCTLYRFEVTSLVTGNGNYPYVATNHGNAWGDALVVVYGHPSLPVRTIAIHDGAEGLPLGTTTTSFAGMPASTGNLILFTEADDTSGQLEQVSLNGVTVAGPGDLFNSNQGLYASLVSIPVTTLAGTNTLDVTTFSDYFGLHLAILRVAGGGELAAGLDVKPGSCPNPFNPRSRGVLPVALVGSDVLDASAVDLASLALARADGIGGSVKPIEGPPGPHSVIADVATPFAGSDCDCHALPGDGTPDLLMRFRSREVASVLALGDLPGGTEVELVLTGNLVDGTAFRASDCVRLVPPKKP